jgi:hypothetical protein
MPGMELPKVAGRNKKMAAQLKLANGMEFGLKRTALTSTNVISLNFFFRLKAIIEKFMAFF